MRGIGQILHKPELPCLIERQCPQHWTETVPRLIPAKKTPCHRWEDWRDDLYFKSEGGSHLGHTAEVTNSSSLKNDRSCTNIFESILPLNILICFTYIITTSVIYPVHYKTYVKCRCHKKIRWKKSKHSSYFFPHRPWSHCPSWAAAEHGNVSGSYGNYSFSSRKLENTEKWRMDNNNPLWPRLRLTAGHTWGSASRVGVRWVPASSASHRFSGVRGRSKKGDLPRRVPWAWSQLCHFPVVWPWALQPMPALWVPHL